MSPSAARPPLLGVAILLVALGVALYLPYLIFGAVLFEGRENLSDAEIARLLEGLELPDYYATERPRPASEELAAQVSDFTWCRFCHTLGSGEPHRVGPNLHRILGRPAAASAGFAYSPAFVAARENGLVWTPENVNAFIADPHGYVPGNRMRYEAVLEEAARQRIVAYLWANTR